MVQDVFTVTKAMLPNCIWSQATGQFPDLSQLLVNVFACPPTVSQRPIASIDDNLSADQTRKLILLQWNAANRVEQLCELYRDSKFAKTIARDSSTDSHIGKEIKFTHYSSNDAPRLQILLESLNVVDIESIQDTWLFGVRNNSVLQQYEESFYNTIV
ncbi:hypothetical protein THRCLA_10639 [Thraustotheca clavata]|uniref:Uncharacterized protein n=1 Tax=Thraustotheca clavata TaxID=74557 RepID=A0A1V9YJ48_9STRA|nr:hypothetical protein THRCLA_10639 [Thraustotheca clavata]